MHVACRSHSPKRLDAHDGEEEVKGLWQELEGLCLSAWRYQFVLLALQRHHVADGEQQFPQALQELLTVLASGAPVKRTGQDTGQDWTFTGQDRI